MKKEKTTERGKKKEVGIGKILEKEGEGVRDLAKAWRALRDSVQGPRRHPQSAGQTIT